VKIGKNEDLQREDSKVKYIASLELASSETKIGSAIIGIFYLLNLQSGKKKLF